MRSLFLSCCLLLAPAAVVVTVAITAAPTTYVPKHSLSDHEHVFVEPERIEVSDSLVTCCELIRQHQHEPAEQDHHRLIQCVNDSDVTFQQQVQARTPYSQSPPQHGPTLNIAVITRATEAVYPYASYAFFLQAVYAQHNGYYSLPLLPDGIRPDYQRYRKLVPVLDAMRTHAMDADYVVWMDADLVVLDLSMRIEQIAAEHPDAHVILSADVSALVNSGFLILRNTPFVEKLLERWLLNHKVSSSYADQSGFEHLYNSQLTDKEKKKIAIVRPDALNSEAPAMGRQATHNQVLHLAAEGMVMRRNSFASGAAEVCAALREGRGPTHQLKMTRKALRQIAEKSYRSENKDIFSKLEGVQYTLGSEDMLLRGVNQLRQDAGKYVYTLFMKNGERDTPEVFEVRRNTITLMTNITDSVVAFIFNHLAKTPPADKPLLEIARLKSDSPQLVAKIPAFTLLLNLVKAKAEMTYEMVMSLQTNIMDGTLSSQFLEEWQSLLAVISESLEFLKEAVSESQQHIILDMQASFLGSTGEMLLALEKTDKAIEVLRESLTIYKEMHKEGLNGDTRSLSASASALAQALCIAGQHEEGLALHRSVIQEEEALVGAYHYRIAAKYLQAASCALQAQPIQASAGRDFTQRTEETMRRNPHVAYSEYERETLQHFKDVLQM